MFIQRLSTYIEKEGSLFPIEFSNLSFIPKRVFFVTNVPKGEIRGLHAHYETQQYLICVQGQIEVFLFDGKVEKSSILLPGEYVFVDKMIWDSQKYLTGNDIMLSLCSTSYDKRDYIIDREAFREITKEE